MIVRRRPRTAALALVGLVSSLAVAAQAHPLRAAPRPDLLTTQRRPPRHERGLRLELPADLQITFTGLLLNVFTPPHRMWARDAKHPLLRSSALNAIDRSVIGNDSRTAGGVSDALLAAHVILPHVATWLDRLATGAGTTRAARESLLLLETLSVSALFCNLVKYMVRRPRPFMYDASTTADRRGDSPRLSFYSGHTAWSFSMATAFSYLFTTSHEGSRWIAPVWIGTHALASTTAVMRVLAGRHFWSDVLVGAAMGSAVGFLVPFLHQRRVGAWVGDLLGHTVDLASLRLVPVIHDEGGWGVNAMIAW